jgi:hypothetical protein
MFDDLRDEANTDASYGDAAGLRKVAGSDTPMAPPASRGQFLGMTAPQRLIIAVLMMISVCVLGTMCLLVTGRIGGF